MSNQTAIIMGFVATPYLHGVMQYKLGSVNGALGIISQTVN